MIQRLIDDFRESTGATVRLVTLGAAAVLALFVTTGFLCAAIFVAVLHKYGVVQACLAGAALFFVVTLIAAGSYMMRKSRIQKQIEARAREAPRSVIHTTLADPMLMAAGLQIVRAIGVKRLVPLLAVGALALGWFASRQSGTDVPAE